MPNLVQNIAKIKLLYELQFSHLFWPMLMLSYLHDWGLGFSLCASLPPHNTVGVLTINVCRPDKLCRVHQSWTSSGEVRKYISTVIKTLTKLLWLLMRGWISLLQKLLQIHIRSRKIHKAECPWLSISSINLLTATAKTQVLWQNVCYSQ